MNHNSWLVLVILLASVILTAGCTSQREITTPSPAPAASLPTPAASLPVPAATSEQRTPVLNRSPDQTSVPAGVTVSMAGSADMSGTGFTRYSNGDFSVDYPSAWTVTTSTYTPYYCKNEVDIERAYYKVCYEKEMQTIGPFSFYENNELYKSPARVVTLASADGKVKFVAFTQDFLDQLDGNVIAVPSYAWVKDEFQKMYPDLYAVNYIANYREFSTGNAKAFSYDIRVPAGHTPSAFTEEVVITVHHLNRFAFITDPGTFTTYQDLKQRMLSSVSVHDIG